jgi:hypothetical protein
MEKRLTVAATAVASLTAVAAKAGATDSLDSLLDTLVRLREYGNDTTLHLLHDPYPETIAFAVYRDDSLVINGVIAHNPSSNEWGSHT